MALITTQDNIRYAIDILSDEISGIFETKPESALDFTGINSISKINLEFVQPRNSEISLAFKIDDIYYTIKGDGTLNPISTTKPTLDLLLKSGQTLPSLWNVTNWANFIGRKVGVIIGLFSPDAENGLPKVKISFTAASSRQELSQSEISPVFNFDKPIKAVNVSYAPIVENGATAKLFMRGINELGQEISYTDPAALIGSEFTQIQFRADYSVSSINNTSARMGPVNFIYAPAKAIISGVTSGDLVSITQNWYLDISQVRMNVKHTPLIKSTLRAYCAFRQKPIQAIDEKLGYGTGAKNTYTLAHIPGLKHDTLKIYFDGERVYPNYEIDTRYGRLTLEAPAGALISCEYEFYWGEEIWQEMTLTSRYEIDGQEISEFKLNIPENNKSVCAIKISLGMTEGNIKGEILGTGAGVTRTYKLARKIKEDNIKIFANNSELSSSNWSMTNDPNFIKIAANSGATITADYSWISETPIIYQFAAVFS